MPIAIDISALRQFSGVFPFLLVLVLVYAMLMLSPWFKDNKGLAAIIAFIFGFMTLFSTIAMKTINMMAPWFVLYVIFIIMFLMVFMMFGYHMKAITEFVSGGEFSVGIWVISIMVIIGLGSLFSVINEEKGFRALTAGNVSGPVPVSEQYGFWQTIFHPKILGMALVLLVAQLTVRYMSKSE